MPRLTASTPVLLVRDVIVAADYYRDCIGFTYDGIYKYPPSFCKLKRDGRHLMLAQVSAGTVLTPHWKILDKTPNAYFWVDEADAVYAEMKTAGSTMDYGPCTQPMAFAS